jgi:hypothetical protein
VFGDNSNRGALGRRATTHAWAGKLPFLPVQRLRVTLLWKGEDMRAFDLGSSPPPCASESRPCASVPHPSFRLGSGSRGSGREVVDARIKSIVFDRTYSVE